MEDIHRRYLELAGWLDEQQASCPIQSSWTNGLPSPRAGEGLGSERPQLHSLRRKLLAGPDDPRERTKLMTWEGNG
jgi:hypothetical protein